MADEDTKVEISIEASQKTGAIDVAAKAFGSLQEGLDKLFGSSQQTNAAVESLNGGLGSFNQEVAKSDESMKGAAGAADMLAGSVAGLLTIGAVTQLFKFAVEEAIKEEEALRTLSFAVQAQGEDWRALRGEIEAYAAAREAATRFDDTVTFETMAKLARATGSVKEAMAATSVAQNLASASNADLATTTQLVSELLLGHERAVIRANKEFGNFAGGARTAQEALDNLARASRGAAVAEESTTKGFAQARASLSNYAQDIGDKLLPMLNKGAEALELIARAGRIQFALLTGDLQKAKDIYNGVAEVQARQAEETKLKARESAQAQEEAGKKRLEIEQDLAIKALEMREGEFQAKREAVEREVEAARQAGVDKLEVVSSGITTSISLEEYRLAKLNEISVEETKRVVEEQKKQQGEKDRQKQIDKLRDEEKKRDMRSTLNFISTLASSKNKELAAIGKAAAISETTISTYLAAQKAYSAMAGIPIIGPALGTAAAALAITAGMARVAAISGIELEQGGLVPGSPGGTAATIGEKGKPEAVIPLTNARALQAIGDAIAQAGGGGGGGGGQLIFAPVFNVPGLEGFRDPRLVQEVFEQFAEALERGGPWASRFALNVQKRVQRDEGRAS
jgi:hypothetical protein